MFNPRFIGILKHPGYNGFDPLSATVETAILADVAAPAVASEAIIPSILTGIGGIGAADTAALAAALGGAGAGTVGSTLASAGLADLASTPLAANALNISGMGGQLAGNVPSVLQGIGGIGATDASTLAAAEAANAVPGTLGSQLSSQYLPSIAPGSIDPATGQLANTATSNTALPSGQFDYNVANVAPREGVNLGTGMPGGTPGAPGVNLPANTIDTLGQSALDKVPVDPAMDITSPSFGKFGQGAADAQGILGKMGLGGLEDFYNKNKLLSSVALSAGMGMLGSKQPGVAPIKKYNGPLNKYHLADNFQAVTPTPNVYKPSYAAEGGIVGFASGGSSSNAAKYVGPGSGGSSSSNSQLFRGYNYNPSLGYYTSSDNPGVAYLPERGPGVMNQPGSYRMTPIRSSQERAWDNLLSPLYDDYNKGKTTTPTTSTPTNTPPVVSEIYKAAYAEPTQTQTNVPVSAAQADPGLWDESMYSEMFAEGGIASYQLGGDVNFNYPQADQHPNQFANQNQLPTAAMGVTKFEPRTDAMTGQMIGFAKGGNTANVPRYTGPGSSNSSPAYGTEAWFNQQFGKFISNLEPSPGSHSGLPTGLDTINPAFGMGYGPRPQQTMPQQTPARAYVSPPPPESNTNIYHPEYQSYAEGDLVEQEQEKKSKLSNPLLEYYSRHTKAKEMMAKPDVGIFHDSDPDTRNLDAQQAALVRLRKQFGYSQMKQPKTNLKEMPSLGTLPGAQYQVQEAADGGIMGYSLGGYASGGNPRLLRGPGDGMSDNIPATIANRQPARLADGEFVVPADVVSHLGNGSTEAGAKHLHTMMDKVRVARTGKKKQGTQINPNKFIPA